MLSDKVVFRSRPLGTAGLTPRMWPASNIAMTFSLESDGAWSPCWAGSR